MGIWCECERKGRRNGNRKSGRVGGTGVAAREREQERCFSVESENGVGKGHVVTRNFGIFQARKGAPEWAKGDREGHDYSTAFHEDQDSRKSSQLEALSNPLFEFIVF